MSYQPDPQAQQSAPAVPAALTVQSLQSAAPGAPGSPETALLDELLARNGQLSASVPNPDPNSPPPGWGELPGQGYAFIDDPEVRQRAELQTTPAMVRMALLRTMETTAQNIRLPYAEQGDQAKASDLILRCAQAYLLIDPEVDATTGVPVVAQALANAAGTMAVNEHQAEHTPQQATSSAGVPLAKPKSTTVGNHVEPPRVKTGAMERLSAMHEGLQKVLSGSRGDTPSPRPKP